MLPLLHLQQVDIGGKLVVAFSAAAETIA